MVTIAIVAPGAMGSAIGERLVERGARVLTSSEGRSEATTARARRAGMVAATIEEIAAADLVLSIVPPGQAVALAQWLAPALGRKSVFLDCNAINPQTMAAVAHTVAGSGCAVLDGAIIGLPPSPGEKGPTLYVSGDPDRRAQVLANLGIVLRHMDGPIGAASALKMTYAGINKGLTGLGTAMLLAAARHGGIDSLRDELAASQPQLLARFGKSIPDMYAKAYRWVAEMREIAGFVGEDDPAALMFEGLAQLFERLAADQAGERDLVKVLDASLGGKNRL
jgi:3-hydroxyisobutyrate dehydrogenase-like beta-hydroxyacid dehydrogenase